MLFCNFINGLQVIKTVKDVRHYFPEPPVTHLNAFLQMTNKPKTKNHRFTVAQ